MTDARPGLRHRATRRRLAGAAARGAFALVLSILLAAAWVAWRNVERALPPPAVVAAGGQESPGQEPDGAYLARAANCVGCHTAPGGAILAGGRAIATPFGTVFSRNLTPHAQHGLGGWTADDLARALQHGRSRDGRLLTPACPFPDFARLERRDIDALHRHLQAMPAVAQPNRAHELRWPYGLQVAQAVWRALYVDPRPLAAEPGKDAAWHRGRYLVEVLGHCGACHRERDAFGGVASERRGGLVSSPPWLAPSLHSTRQAGVASWSEDEIVALLQTGVSPRGSTLGPMADVVFRSTQHLSTGDLQAMARYLRTLPPLDDPAAVAPPAAPAVLAAGRRLYEAHCEDCHGEAGQGEPGAYPPLAGNRAVMLDDPRNLIQVLRHGGFTPTTAGQPRPWGMPPFVGVLDAAEMAAVATYVRQSWGHAASEVTPLDVLRTP